MIDHVFLWCAVLGGGVFAVRTIAQLFGFGSGDGIDAADFGDSSDVHANADDGFRLLSLQGVTAFLMMFGLTGLALTRQSGVGPTVSIAAAVLAAFFSTWIIGRIFSSMGALQSKGNVKIVNAIGQEGVVYLSIGAGSTGKVQVEVQGRLGVYDAQADDGAAIATGKRVRVVRVAPGDLLIVSAAV